MAGEWKRSPLRKQSAYDASSSVAPHVVPARPSSASSAARACARYPFRFDMLGGMDFGSEERFLATVWPLQ